MKKIPIKKILIADDDMDFVTVFSSRLRVNNYDVVTAYDSDEALEVLKRENLDIILIDLRMPGGGGVKVINTLKKDGGGLSVPVVVISAYIDEMIKSQVKQLGVKEVMEKPLSPERLLAVVNKVLQSG